MEIEKAVAISHAGEHEPYRAWLRAPDGPVYRSWVSWKIEQAAQRGERLAEIDVVTRALIAGVERRRQRRGLPPTQAAAARASRARAALRELDKQEWDIQEPAPRRTDRGRPKKICRCEIAARKALML